MYLWGSGLIHLTKKRSQYPRLGNCGEGLGQCRHRQVLMRSYSALTLRGLALVLFAWGTAAADDDGKKSSHLALNQVAAQRFLLKQEGPDYRNYAFETYANYPNHTHPYDDTAKIFYGPLGYEQIRGYHWYSWRELRMPGLNCSGRRGEQCGSVINWPCTTCQVVASDSYGGWGYSAVVGLTGALRFTPLTLSRTYSRGFRLDLSTPYLKATAHAARVEHVHGIEVDDSTLMLANRVQADLGVLTLGLNWVNLHQFQSTRPGNSIRGRLRSFQPLADWIVVRFKDDSPRDGGGGAQVHEVTLILNGKVRPDIQPVVIRHRTGAATQAGRYFQADGSFRPSPYSRISGTFYRGQEVPYYVDYLYRIAHARGEDVSANTNLDGLLKTFSFESPEEILRADGEEQLVFLFEVGGEAATLEAEVEAVVGNDSRIGVSTIAEVSPRSRDYVQRYSATFYRTVFRAAGNVQDGSNLRKVRFRVGEQVAHFVYGTDLKLALPGIEINAEYARSAAYLRYPAHVDRVPAFRRSPRFADRGAAYFINATHWFEGGLVGGEFFALNPDYSTEMRQYMDPVVSTYRTAQHRQFKWVLVEDNDEADIWPDILLVGYDLDGVFPGQDEDQNGIPDIDRDFDGVPDYEEPFLMFDVEPSTFVYGLDRNHNDEPDHREDDWKEDYPYDFDQRGYHLFGQFGLGPHWSFGAGRFSLRQIAGDGRNRSTYALLGYRYGQADRPVRLFMENNFRLVQDDIADLYLTFVDPPERLIRQRNSSARRNLSQVREDYLRYRDSYVNESYVEAALRPWSTLYLEQKLRLRLNWQQGGRLPGSTWQGGRRLDLWTSVSKVEWALYLGKLSLKPQFKFLFQREVDRAAAVELRWVYRLIPILRLHYALMPRTGLQAGVQGVGSLPYRLEDQTRRRNSFEQRTSFVQLINLSKYFGYELYTSVGFKREKLVFDHPLQAADEYGSGSFFVRAAVGWPGFGRML